MNRLALFELIRKLLLAVGLTFLFSQAGFAQQVWISAWQQTESMTIARVGSVSVAHGVNQLNSPKKWQIFLLW